jgi:hypothetical protein
MDGVFVMILRHSAIRYGVLWSALAPIAFAGALIAGAAASAAPQMVGIQVAQAGGTMRDKPPAAESVSTDEIATYARATTKVQFIRRDFEVQKRSANSPQQVAQLTEVANNQMVEAVETEGLTVERFNEISEAADADPELRGRILDQIGKQQ